MESLPVVQVVDWHAVGVLMAFIVLWSGVMFWGAKHLLGRLEAKLDHESGEWRRIEREMNSIWADLPKTYVMREDWIRFGGAIDAKLDAVHREISALKDRLYERLGPGKSEA